MEQRDVAAETRIVAFSHHVLMRTDEHTGVSMYRQFSARTGLIPNILGVLDQIRLLEFDEVQS